MSAVIEIPNPIVKRTLTDREIWDQQDFVDNTVHSLIEELLGRKMEWDIHITGDVRDAIIETLEFHGLATEDELYPFVPEEDQMMDDAPDERASFAGFVKDIAERPFRTLATLGAIALMFAVIFIGLPFFAALLGY